MLWIDRRRTLRSVARTLSAAALLTLVPGAGQGVVTLVEPGHTLSQIVDSAAPLHPSQAALDSACAFGNLGNVESVGIDAATGTLYMQISSGGFTSFDTCIFAVTPAGVATALNLSTGFGINSRGTDLHLDPTTGLLLTQDQNTFPEAIASVAPGSGLVGTYSDVTPPIFGSGTFGMDFSVGVPGGDVPAGDVVFTSDVIANGLHSAFFGGIASMSHVTPPTAGDDMVVQPDGDWVHVPDFAGIITAYSPVPPHPGAPSGAGLSVGGMFGAAALPFVFGSRATVCDATGDMYVSFSGGFGGSGIFRVDEALTTATLVLTISGSEGLHDLTEGPSSSGGGSSVYFTVHDLATLGEEMWEVTTPECVPPNQPPDCSSAAADPDELWPPNHKFRDVAVAGVTDPDGDPIAITIDSIFQDEPVEGLGDGNTCPDGDGLGSDTAGVRAERSGTLKTPGDGRVYHVGFTADDGQGAECSSVVTVCVPHDQRPGHVCVDQGPIFDSTVCGP